MGSMGRILSGKQCDVVAILFISMIPPELQGTGICPVDGEEEYLPSPLSAGTLCMFL
jgi:hypothetical protein